MDFYSSEQPSALSLLTPEDLRRVTEDDDLDLDSNILDLYPSPVHLVRILKAIDRSDISSQIFVKLLEMYRGLKSESESDPMQYVPLLANLTSNSNGPQ